MSIKKKLLSLIPVSHAAFEHTTASDPLQSFMFTVKIGNNTAIGFQKVSGLSVDLNVVEYHEGCVNYPMKLAGKASFSEVTCEKGVIPYKSNSSLSSTTNVLDFLSAVASDGTERYDVEINLLDRRGYIRARYILKHAFVSKWEAPDLDASSDDVAIEKIVFNYDYFEYQTFTTSSTTKGDFYQWGAKKGTTTKP